MERLCEKWPCSLGPMLSASRWCRKEIKESMHAMLELHCLSLGPEELPLGILPSHHLTLPCAFHLPSFGTCSFARMFSGTHAACKQWGRVLGKGAWPGLRDTGRVFARRGENAKLALG